MMKNNDEICTMLHKTKKTVICWFLLSFGGSSEDKTFAICISNVRVKLEANPIWVCFTVYIWIEWTHFCICMKMNPNENQFLQSETIKISKSYDTVFIYQP